MQPTVSHAESRFSKTSQLFVLLAAEKLLFWLLQLKTSLSFSDLGFGDAGANFTMHYLSGLGLRPALDFGYLYGLLPLLIGRFWFGLFGPTPMSLAVLALVCRLVVVWSIARIAVRYSVGIPAIAFVVVALPYAVGVFTGLNIAHHLEAALLSVALAEQAYGRRSTALALATAACFTKPSLGYVYGLLLLIFIFADLRQRNRVSAGEIARSLVPAALTGLLLISILALVYGAGSVVATLYPRTGFAVYRASNFGLFGEGRTFFHPPGANWRWYIGNPTGLWLLGSIWLLGNAVFSGWRILSTRQATLEDEMILTCGLLHVAFVMLAFGNGGSWIYYSQVWLIGIELTGSRRTSFVTSVFIVFTFLGLLSYRASLPSSIAFWRTSVSGPDTAGLWASPEERGEWDQAERIADGHRAALLIELGAGGLLLRGFEEPVAASLFPGGATSGELERQAQQLKDASVIVVGLQHTENYRVLLHYPEMGRALEGTRRVFHGKYFDVYVRDAP
jgi:hypothetical protein